MFEKGLTGVKRRLESAITITSGKVKGPRLGGQIFVRQAKPGKGGSHVERGRKPFDGTQQVPTPARQRKGIQPEASLAWWRGNPSCET